MYNLPIGNTANVDTMDNSGRTALHLACETSQFDLVQILLEHDANVDLEDGYGRRTPLYIAANEKASEIVNILIANGASVLNTCYDKTIKEVIGEKMPYFDIEKVEIKKKPRRNSINDLGYGLNRILDQAKLFKVKGQSLSQSLVQFKTLMKRFKSADLDDFNASGMTLLQKSCDYGLTEFSSLLLGKKIMNFDLCTVHRSRIIPSRSKSPKSKLRLA